MLGKHDATLSAYKSVLLAQKRAHEFLMNYQDPHDLLSKLRAAVNSKNIKKMKAVILQINKEANVKINPNVTVFQPEQIPNSVYQCLGSEQASVITQGRLWAKFFKATLTVIYCTFSDRKSTQQNLVQRISNDLHSSNDLFNSCYYSFIADLKKETKTDASLVAPTQAQPRSQFQPTHTTFRMAQPFPIT